MYRLTMVGKGVCYTAPLQEQVWLQSHTSSLGPPRLCDGLYTESLCTENLQGQTYGQIDNDFTFYTLVLAPLDHRGETSRHSK